MKELFIDRGITQSRAAVFENGILQDLYIENADFSTLSGNVYKGRIENQVISLNAAFVNIGLEKNAILHFENENKLREYKRGQEIIVQIIREGIDDKGPRVSEEISIPGKYVVLLPGDDYLGVSRKIDDFDSRKRIKEIIKAVYEEGYGVIVRTEGQHAEEAELQADYLSLKNMWKEIEQKSSYMKPPMLLFNSKDFYEFIVREYVKADVDKIHINRGEDINCLKEKLSSHGPDVFKKLVYEEYNFTMQESIEKEISKAENRRLKLQSGGYIIVDYTEAFTCIDVNSGTFTGNLSSEETIFKVNLEACREIGNIIKLRNISGVILIDFIDMKNEEHKKLIIEAIEKEFSDDRSKLKVYGFTKLGILETARGKKGKRISEFIYSREENMAQAENIASYGAYGSKRHFSASYCLKLIENKCLKASKHYKRSSFDVIISDIIYNEAKDMLPVFITEMKRIYGIILSIASSKDIQEFAINQKA